LPPLSTPSLHDALPIYPGGGEEDPAESGRGGEVRVTETSLPDLLQCRRPQRVLFTLGQQFCERRLHLRGQRCRPGCHLALLYPRSEEHTSELQSRLDLV